MDMDTDMDRDMDIDMFLNVDIGSKTLEYGFGVIHAGCHSFLCQGALPGIVEARCLE